MKVLLVNGSQNAKGTTNESLGIVAKELNAQGIETEIYQPCPKIYQFDPACLDEAVKKINEADAFVFGSPVHYAATSGSFSCFMDALFGRKDAELAFKPAAAIAVERRAGGSATLDEMQKYFLFKQMPIVSSNYWNIVHARTADKVAADEEAVQTLRILGKNMVWMLNCLKAGKEAGVKIPEQEEKINSVYR